jgi:hypothetical protein
MLSSQLIHHFNGVETSILGDSAGNDLQSLSESSYDLLSLSGDGTSMVLQVTREFQFNCTSSSNNLAGLVATTHNHDGIVEGAFSLLDELFSSSSEYECSSTTLGAILEEVVPLSSNLNLLKHSTCSKDVLS